MCSCSPALCLSNVSRLVFNGAELRGRGRQLRGGRARFSEQAAHAPERVLLPRRRCLLALQLRQHLHFPSGLF